MSKCITGHGAPTLNTVATIGQRYVDLDTCSIYECKAINSNKIDVNSPSKINTFVGMEYTSGHDITYVWEQVGGAGGAKPDLAQNNPEAADYVKNRTHWTEEETDILIDETITVTMSYYEDTQFYYGFSKTIDIKPDVLYDVTFLGETFNGVVPDGGWLHITLSGGARIDITTDAIISQPNDGLTRPFTTDFKLVERCEEVHTLDPKYVPITPHKVYKLNKNLEFADTGVKLTADDIVNITNDWLDGTATIVMFISTTMSSGGETIYDIVTGIRFVSDDSMGYRCCVHFRTVDNTYHQSNTPIEYSRFNTFY